MTFLDLELSRRLERAEGHACVQYAEARRHLFPDSGAEWIECAGAYAVFDGIESPVTQTFGLGIFDELSAAGLDVMERFFLDRGAPVLHEVSPFAGVAALQLLCERNYRPIELSNVLCRPVERPPQTSRVSSACGSSRRKKRNCGVTSARGDGHMSIPNLAIFFEI